MWQFVIAAVILLFIVYLWYSSQDTKKNATNNKKVEVQIKIANANAKFANAAANANAINMQQQQIEVNRQQAEQNAAIAQQQGNVKTASELAEEAYQLALQQRQLEQERQAAEQAALQADQERLAAEEEARLIAEDERLSAEENELYNQYRSEKRQLSPGPDYKNRLNRLDKLAYNLLLEQAARKRRIYGEDKWYSPEEYECKIEEITPFIDSEHQELSTLYPIETAGLSEILTPNLEKDKGLKICRYYVYSKDSKAFDPEFDESKASTMLILQFMDEKTSDGYKWVKYEWTP